MDREFAVLTALGGDRVGIADDISAALAERKCNIEESKMAVLGGEFAVILLLSAAPATMGALAADIDDLGRRFGLVIALKRTKEHVATVPGIPYLIETISQDTPGIVHSVTTVLRKHGVNIEDLETETTPAPLTGAPLFHMRGRIVLPRSLAANVLKKDFASLEESQDLHVEMKPLFPMRQE